MKDLRHCTQHPKKAYKRTICVVKPALYTEDGSQALGNVQPGMGHLCPTTLSRTWHPILCSIYVIIWDQWIELDEDQMSREEEFYQFTHKESRIRERCIARWILSAEPLKEQLQRSC